MLRFHWMSGPGGLHVLFVPSGTRSNQSLPPLAGDPLNSAFDLFGATLCLWLYSILVTLDDRRHSNIYTRAATYKHRIHSVVAVASDLIIRVGGKSSWGRRGKLALPSRMLLFNVM
jgi:hypothetical protein